MSIHRLCRAALALCLSALALSASAQYNYTLSWDNPATHLYTVTLETNPAGGGHTDFQMALWRPGRYIEQNFAAAVSGFSAVDVTGKPLAWQKVDKETWRVQNPTTGRIKVSYKYYANVLDAGSTVLNHEQAYFNGSNLFMHVRDKYMEPCTLTVASMPQEWKSGTALGRIQGRSSPHNVFTAPDYHEFVDCPTILSPTLHSFSTQVLGSTIWYHFQGGFTGGKPTEDKLIEDGNKIITEQAALFGGKLPFEEYHFVVQLLPYNSRHAVEHKNSSCYTLPQTVATSPKAVASMYSILSHEFFHLWNVKRIRPASLWPYDYQRIQYTTLHWFTEGVTDYYTSLAMVRSGTMTREAFCETMSQTITALENDYANEEVSPAMASFDSWLVRSPYLNPNLNTSYYPLGERVGLLLDLEIRRRSEGLHSLDEVMAYLWANAYQKDQGVAEDGVQKAVETITGESYAEFFSSYVNGVKPIDYAAFFKPFGLVMKVEDAEGSWENIGIVQLQKASVGMYVQAVRPDGDAVRAGLTEGDVITELNGKSALALDPAEFFGSLKKGDKVTVKFTRWGEAKTAEVTVTDATLPKVYGMELDPKPSKKEQAAQDAWLASMVK